MAGGKRRAVRELADFVADYGVLPGPVDYEQYVGLVLSQERARLRKVYFAGLAHTLAASGDDLPEEVVRAACDTAEAFRRLLFEINAARAARRKGY